MSKKQSNHGASNVAAKKKRTVIMVVALSIACVIVIGLVWLTSRMVMLNPKSIDVDDIRGEDISISANATPGAETYENVRFAALFGMTVNSAKTTAERVTYSNADGTINMTVTSQAVQNAYKEMDKFSDIKTANSLTNNIDLVRYAFEQDISSINVLSSSEDIKFAATVRQIRYSYAPSANLTYSEINGNLHGCMCYNFDKGICAFDIVSPDNEMYSIEISSVNAPLAKSDMISFLQSIAFM